MAVLVNGLPAAGKSTLAPKLATAPGLPLQSKHILNDALADTLGADPPIDLTQREWNATRPLPTGRHRRGSARQLPARS